MHACIHTYTYTCTDVVSGGGTKRTPYFNRFRGMEELATVLANTRILKAGVGVDLDCIDLFRVHRLAVCGTISQQYLNSKP